MKPPRRPRPLLAAVGFLPLAFLTAGCGPDRPPLYPVRGEVSFRGKPTPGALVVFRKEGQKGPQPPPPSGYVKDDGSFVLSTYAPEDGAPEGEYRVAISWTSPQSRMDRESGEVRNRLPERYANPQTSKLRAKVEKGANNHPVFRLNP